MIKEITIRDEVLVSLINGNYALESLIKDHETNYNKLYISPSGELYWEESIDINSHKKTDKSLIRIGKGSLECNCGCNELELTYSDDTIRNRRDQIIEKLDRIPEGFFQDENGEDLNEY